ncbi:hypothetical protein EJ08DRAFT_651219 [Tothia fuscella]|uniref:Uncharacterized protein n=1 Tax=Tothia fuscella TaxID=1048955 RepID=A0A9P4TW99_9PEZI|nr:hypothetical protein EJ08DRAFT_651219 [Tothia fuscella]
MWYGAAVIGKPQTWCSTVEQSTTRPFNLKDLRGPVPSSAYFDALPSLHKQLGARGVCRETICEDFYFPNIAMPTVVTELEPAFARCNPFAQNKHFKKPWYWVNGVWDPPIAFPIATAVKTLTMSDWAQSQTATPGAAIPELVAQPTEAPSRSETRPEAPSRPDMQSEAHLPDFAGRSTTQASILPKTTPITTITAKNAEITVFLNPNPQYVAAIESQLIRPGDPPSIIEGQTFSLNPNGHIIINGVQTIQLPKPGFPSAVHISTTIVRIDKNLFTATIFPSQNGVSGYIAIGSVTLHPGGSQVDVGGKTIRLGTDGVLLDGAIPIASLTSYGYTTSPTPEDEREGSIRYTTAKDYKVNAEKSGGIRSNGVSRSIGVSGCIIFGLFILVYFLE